MRNDHFFPQRELRLSTAILCVLAVSVIGQETNPAPVNVWAWGRNDWGQTNVPPDLTNAIAVAAGGVFSLALRADGTVRAWGDNWNGACNVPVGLSNVVTVVAGSSLPDPASGRHRGELGSP